ncbi:hypothetical protein DLM78_17865 [Leptospira stimsonii]|uniref:Uncharacterized protein n=1 Tax=Leptospira stimsonii TaxID=2202203 RepID=A0A8B3CMM5_9LEPT|nr:hypothetical protein DLM78_17865 [Leptospira stimsonii]
MKITVPESSFLLCDEKHPFSKNGEFVENFIEKLLEIKIGNSNSLLPFLMKRKFFFLGTHQKRSQTKQAFHGNRSSKQNGESGSI